MINRQSFLKLAGVSTIPAAAVAVPTVATAEVAPWYQKHGTYSHGTDLTRPGVVHRGGVIRLYSTGPTLHVNASHQSFGILPKSVKINSSGNIEVALDHPLPVVTTNVSPDETLVARDVEAGISGGGSVCVFWVSKAGVRLNLSISSNYRLIAGSTSNLWFGVTSYFAG